jgi:hypothetical protein
MNGSQALGAARCGLFLTLSVTAFLAAPTLAHSVQLDGIREGTQSVTMCSNCSGTAPCAQVNDYRITLSADLDRPTSSRSARFTVRLTDRLAVPVTDAAVTLVIPATDRAAPRQVVTMTGGHDGLYRANVTLRSDPLRDSLKATVFVTTPKGDRVKQRFGLAFLVCHRTLR